MATTSTMSWGMAAREVERFTSPRGRKACTDRMVVRGAFDVLLTERGAVGFAFRGTRFGGLNLYVWLIGDDELEEWLSLPGLMRVFREGEDTWENSEARFVPPTSATHIDVIVERAPHIYTFVRAGNRWTMYNRFFDVSAVVENPYLFALAKSEEDPKAFVKVAVHGRHKDEVYTKRKVTLKGGAYYW